MTQFSLRMEPPQKWNPEAVWSETIQFQELGTVSTPPTIRPLVAKFPGQLTPAGIRHSGQLGSGACVVVTEIGWNIAWIISLEINKRFL